VLLLGRFRRRPLAARTAEHCPAYARTKLGGNLQEGVEGQVQQLLTLRIGSLWFDVPICSLLTLLSQSLFGSTGPSSTKQDKEKVGHLYIMEAFTRVLPKPIKQNIKSA
jgi:hypothetical protein